MVEVKLSCGCVENDDRIVLCAQHAPTPDVDEAIEQAWHRLYAKMEQVTPIKPEGFAGERQAMAIVKSLGEELRTAANALERTAETLKLRPNMGVTERLQLANATIKAARRAREAAESVLG